MTNADDVDEPTIAKILVLIASQVEAWNEGDAEAFAARALPEILFTNVMGMFSVGKAPFVAQHKRIFATIYEGSTIRQEIEHITLLKPDVAIVNTLVIGTGFKALPPGVQAIDGAVHTKLQQVLVRQLDTWQVAAFHNVAVNPVASSGSPPQ